MPKIDHRQYIHFKVTSKHDLWNQDINWKFMTTPHPTTINPPNLNTHTNYSGISILFSYLIKFPPL